MNKYLERLVQVESVLIHSYLVIFLVRAYNKGKPNTL